MSDNAKQKAELEASQARAKGERRQRATNISGQDVTFLNEALGNSHDVMNTLASPDAPPPPPKKPKG